MNKMSVKIKCEGHRRYLKVRRLKFYDIDNYMKLHYIFENIIILVDLLRFNSCIAQFDCGREDDGPKERQPMLVRLRA